MRKYWHVGGCTRERKATKRAGKRRDRTPVQATIQSIGDKFSGKTRQEKTTCSANRAFIIFYPQQTLITGCLPAGRTVILFQLTDTDTMNKWYLVAENGRTELCDEDRALEVDVYVTADRRTLGEVWMGDINIARACADGRLKLAGAPALVKSFPRWLSRSPFFDVRSESLKQRMQ